MAATGRTFISSARSTTVSGKVLYEHNRGSRPRVVRPEIVGMMNSMMTETIEGGTASKAAFAWPSAGKTGTSQKSRDAWFIGYTANLTTGVWFGNDDGAPMKKVTGGALPAIAWHDFMVAAHEGVPVAALPGGWSARRRQTRSCRSRRPMSTAPMPARRMPAAAVQAPSASR